MDDNVSVMGDWALANPSPRTLISNFLNEEFGSRSFPDLVGEDGNVRPSPESNKQMTVMTPKQEHGNAGFGFSSDLSLEPSLLDVHKTSSRGGLAERMAARAGFNGLKLNTAQIRSANLSSSPSEVRSPYLTIPPGLSPTTLLDSPVFLSNMVQPSPTTGKLLFEQYSNANSASASTRSDKATDHKFDDVVPDSFAFKPHLDSSSSYFTSAENKGASAMDHHQSLPTIEVSVQSEHPPQARSIEAGGINYENQQEFNFQPLFADRTDKQERGDENMFNQKVSDSFMGSEQSPPLDDQNDGEADPKGEFSSTVAGTPAEDGYNWRKYGQKQVKGSEYPRSYYKCTHPNCQVKKKVERSHEGHITEIIYKGAHNHPKPPPNRRSGIAPHPFNDMQLDNLENSSLQAGHDSNPAWLSTQNGSVGQEWTNDGLEVTSSASVAAEFGYPSASMTQDGPRFESSDAALDVSSTLSNEEEDDRATHGSVSLGGEGEEDESESKRRKMDTCPVDMSAASRAVREPRVVVQTTSEVDILDDGYRWRKYGQKVVKGNPNPRSYYKCTNPGCTVRKHVERASHDLKSVITTYEGKHNHDVPAARTGGGGISHPSSGPPAAPPSQSHSLPRRPEPTQAQDSFMRFESQAPLGAFGFPGREQLGPAAGFAFGMGQRGLTNLTMPGLSSMAPMRMPVLPPVNPYLAHRQATEGFMMPKGEPKEEPMPDPRLPMPNGGSGYHQMMSRLPL